MKRYVKASSTSGFVGIWWIYDDIVLADMKPLDEGYNDGYLIHYDDTKNHSTEWRKVVHESFPESEAETIIKKGYKSIERGRVVYNIRTMCYEITCSEAISTQIDKLKLVVDTFNLNNCRYDFLVEHHYHIAEITGNPALDAFEYGV